MKIKSSDYGKYMFYLRMTTCAKCFNVEGDKYCQECTYFFCQECQISEGHIGVKYCEGCQKDVCLTYFKESASNSDFCWKCQMRDIIYDIDDLIVRQGGYPTCLNSSIDKINKK